MQRNDHYRWLASSAIFGGLDEACLARIAQEVQVLRFPAGTSLFRQDDEADGLHILSEGLVRIHIGHRDGRELTLALLDPGDVIGEIALLDGLPRTATATALAPTRTVFVGRRAFAQLLEEIPQLAIHVILVLCDRLRQNTEQLTANAFLDLRQRLLKLLHDLAVAHGEIDADRAIVPTRFTQTDIAQMLGVTREAVNKQFRALSRDGVIEMTAGAVVLARGRDN
ncbi:MAG: Crp/Fnr family transcriptional regulator [Chelatococcus sp.]|jgi:CRP/FNR family cyclic AMP-dependent transcriptional regulator|uniref:Crp/Fnr family transcriptional regulator n=1 Tax=unclassified Chelatococcus TaxID=2638111 RepID=UPI001BCD3AF9|nr:MULTISPECIES: Crp/Fnr family transcriptional regulator [unclassified Chelatococcus]MBS7739199.1 Crp/Fnr family transcriptional regulator [Chelatococcus sp. HY11]MBX3540148.1 Crp/Fnr family transcriptional regulator [Chelatococcus sp.]MBX3543689.1 Crp/Fnr family transcriptional regulator [Chelatococcus sp.]MCO5076268.1 Crp/Fnr family transcriptional regulator [Chelatococcus sp.]